MKYFVARGEDRRLDEVSRRDLRGSFASLTHGVTHYELSGPEDGPMAVLVGGLTTPLFYWDAMTPELHDRGIRTLAFSGYGRGYSDRVRRRYDEELFVQQLGELTEQLGIRRPFHLAGASMGALTAMAFAASHASSVASMTLVAPAGLDRRPALHRVLARDWTATLVAKRFGDRFLQGHLDKEVLDPRHAVPLAEMLADAFRYEGSTHAVFDTLQHYPLFGRTERFRDTANLRIPTSVLWGDTDRVTPTVALEKAKVLLRPSKLHVIAQCGHMPPLERPSEVAAHFAAFVDTRESGRQHEPG